MVVRNFAHRDVEVRNMRPTLVAHRGSPREDARTERCRWDETTTEGELSREQLDEVVRQLNRICLNSSLEFALRVGAVIVHNFYGGDMEAWRHRGPKLHSFRSLAEHPDLALSPGALNRCVAIFEMCERLRAQSRWRRLGASHLRVVIGIPTEAQEHLLSKANEERWSVQELHARALTLRADRGRGGRRAQSRLARHLGALDRCFENWSGVVDSVHTSATDELERSAQLIAKMKASLDALVRVVEARRLRLIETNEPE